MNKTELINKIAEQSALEPKIVEKVLNTFEDVVIKKLQNMEQVNLTGFVSFSARERSARKGVDPRNPSRIIDIPAVVVPKFKAGKTLKDALKKGKVEKKEDIIETPETQEVVLEKPQETEQE